MAETKAVERIKQYKQEIAETTQSIATYNILIKLKEFTQGRYRGEFREMRLLKNDAKRHLKTLKKCLKLAKKRVNDYISEDKCTKSAENTTK